MAERGRGSRRSDGHCPVCGAECSAPPASTDAHRMWAQRHADATGHTARVITESVRTYEPRSTP